MKKISIIFSITFILIAGLWADGVQPTGTGTEADPYEVTTLSNLLWISTNQVSWDKHYIQTADIDASTTSNWNGGAGFSPIGNYSAKFTGNYDGGNHTISNLFINSSNFYSGLFGYTESNHNVIKDLGITDCDISGTSFVGALIGNSDIEIEHCFSSGSISATVNSVGGLVGKNSEKILRSFSTCSVTGGYEAGGLVGYSEYQINECFSTGNIVGTGNIGGFVGRNEASVENCFSSGDVSGNDFYEKIGGFCGSVSGGSIWLCYSLGDVYNYNNFTDHGFIGTEIGFTNYLSNFFDSEASNQQTDDLESATPKTSAEMKTVSTFTDEWWDFAGESANGVDDLWNIDPSVNDGYPYLVALFETASLPTPQNLAISISDTEITLSWDAVPGASSYKVYSCATPNGVFEENLSGSFAAESWTALSPSESAKLFYHVTALSD